MKWHLFFLFLSLSLFSLYLFKTYYSSFPYFSLKIEKDEKEIKEKNEKIAKLEKDRSERDVKEKEERKKEEINKKEEVKEKKEENDLDLTNEKLFQEEKIPFFLLFLLIIFSQVIVYYFFYFWRSEYQKNNNFSWKNSPHPLIFKKSSWIIRTLKYFTVEILVRKTKLLLPSKEEVMNSGNSSFFFMFKSILLCFAVFILNDFVFYFLSFLVPFLIAIFFSFFSFSFRYCSPLKAIKIIFKRIQINDLSIFQRLLNRFYQKSSFFGSLAKIIFFSLQFIIFYFVYLAPIDQKSDEYQINPKLLIKIYQEINKNKKKKSNWEYDYGENNIHTINDDINY